MQFGNTPWSADWHAGDDSAAGSRTRNGDSDDVRCGDASRSVSHSGSSQLRSPASQDDRARGHPARVDTDEQADGHGRPGANPRETRKLSRPL